MLTTFLVSAGLVAGSLVLVALHVRAWRATDHGGLAERDYEFHRRQYRRRMQASGMLGLIGILIAGHYLITDTIFLALYWTLVLVLILWAVLLALADGLSSWAHYRPLVASQEAEHAALQREIEKYRREQADKPKE